VSWAPPTPNQQAEHEQDQEDNEQNLRDVRRSASDSRESEQGGDDGEDQEGDSSTKHVGYRVQKKSEANGPRRPGCKTLEAGDCTMPLRTGLKGDEGPLTRHPTGWSS
jgi:hypothetical protein